jgi:sentrin-specific protease 1
MLHWKFELVICIDSELSEDQDAIIDRAIVAYPPGEVLVEGFKLQLTRRDIATLSGLNWLNDEVIFFS